MQPDLRTSNASVHAHHRVGARFEPVISSFMRSWVLDHMSVEIRVCSARSRHGIARREQRQRTSEQVLGCREIFACGRAFAGCRQAGRRLTIDLRVRTAELAPVARGLFEVVADDLVELDESARVPLEPVGEALVQVGARCLRQRVVGGVADQEVAEAVGVVAGQRRAVRTDRAPCGRAPSRCASTVAGRRRRAPRRRRVEHWPSTAPRSSTARSAAEPVEPRREQRLDRRRHASTSPPSTRAQREHLLDEQRVALGRREDARARVARRRSAARACRAAPRTRVAAAARAAPSSRSACRRPSRAARRAARAARCTGAGSARRATVGEVSTRSRNVGSAQWMSSKTTTSGRSLRGLLEQPADGQDDLRRRGAARRPAARDRVGRQLGRRRRAA